MNCIRCGKEIGEAKHCPYCGEKQNTESESEKKIKEILYSDKVEETAAKYEEPQERGSFSYEKTETFYEEPFENTGANSVAAYFKKVFSLGEFKVTAIMFTLSAILRAIASTSGYETSFDIFQILYIVALWLILSQAKSDSPEFKATGFKIASGTLKATKILIWVLIGFMIFGAILLPLVGGVLTEVIGSMVITDPSTGIIIHGFDSIPQLNPFLVMGSMIGFEVLIIIGIVVAIFFNLLCFRNLHKFAKSFCTSLESGRDEIVCAKSARKWLFVFMVFNGLSVLFTSDPTVYGLVSKVSKLLAAMACALAAGMVKEYFMDHNI